MTIESTRETMQRYFNSEHNDTSMMAKDVVFTVMATGQEHQGPEAVLGMLNYFYHVAFEATANTRVTLFGENNAMVEGDFVGKHIGEFAGIPATGKQVHFTIYTRNRFDGDRMAERWDRMDFAGLLEHLKG